MKKILISIYNLQGGGAEKVLLNLLESLDSKKYEITLLVLRKEGIYLDKIPSFVNVKYGFKTLFGKKISNKVLSFLNEKLLYKVFINEKYDIEISFLEGYSTKVISGSYNLSSKKIAWVHADFNNYHWTNKFLKLDDEKKYYSKFDEIVCVSSGCSQSFKKIFGFENKLNVIYNLLDKNLECYDNVKFNDVFKNYKTTKLLYVGRLEREKGVDRLICAFKECVDDLKTKDIVLFILGDGSLKIKLENLVKRNCLENNVKFIPFKENVYDYLKSSDYVVVPSYSESFSLVLAESVCLGKVCISTDTCGAREVLKDGEYGVLVENSKEGIKQGIMKVLINKHLKSEYENKLINWKENFRRDRIISKIENLMNL